jgi:glycerophosphoryl diester phosphodiesterase
MSKLYFVLFLILCMSCQKTLDAPIPDTSWSLFNSSSAQKLTDQTRQAMEGVYTVHDGADQFGDLVALKWSFVTNGTDSSYHLSVFSGKDIAYFTMEGKRLGDSLLFNGYWRKLVNTETGIIRFTISSANGAKQLLSQTPVIGKDSIIMTGVYGDGQNAPTKKIVFSWLRKLYQGQAFEILAHRSGGRTSDLLPFSENSIGMIKYTSQLGSTGIEIDVRLTKDGIPVLYHDNTLNLRLIQKNGLVGPIEDYTYDQLRTFVRLIDGEQVPSLRQALDTVVYHTALRFIWLDTKYEGPLQVVRDLQSEYLQKASAAGRNLQIVIGIPNEGVMNQFQQLTNYQSIPSLCELTVEDVQNLNSKVWAPRWTLGLQTTEVTQMQSQGRKAFVWTLDVPDYVDQFINQGNFDGILSNYPSLVAYYHYVKQ